MIRALGWDYQALTCGDQALVCDDESTGLGIPGTDQALLLGEPMVCC